MNQWKNNYSIVIHLDLEYLHVKYRKVYYVDLFDWLAFDQDIEMRRNNTS